MNEKKKKSWQFARSLYVAEDIEAGEKFTEKMSGRSGPDTVCILDTFLRSRGKRPNVICKKVLN